MDTGDCSDIEQLSPAEPTVSGTPSFRLTPNEQAVLNLLCRGLCCKEISYEMDISQQQVSIHKKNLMLKLHIPSDFHIVLIAVRYGLVSSDLS